MGIIFLILACVVLAVIAPTVVRRFAADEYYDHSKDRRVKGTPPQAALVGTIIRYVFAALAIVSLLGTSFVTVGTSEVGHLKRIYSFTGHDLPPGKIIATESDMKGPQSEILAPGFHLRLGLNILYDVDTSKPVIRIPDGKYGYLIARDGKPMPPDQTYAEAFPSSDLLKMLDATYFLTKGNGTKGPQTSILTPGDYRINQYLWEVKVGNVTEIPKGHVGVIKSNVLSSVNFGDLKVGKPTSCVPTLTKDHEGGRLSVPLVPVGCIGIWDTPLYPGKYYINSMAYDVTLIDTRVQAWEYVGGFIKRSVDLTVDQKGEITQTKSEIDVKIPEHAADAAIGIKIDGYTIRQQLRALVQVEPNMAPYIVASVGGLEEVEDRIVTPAIQSTTRDLSGQFINVTEPLIDEKTSKPVTDKDGNVKTRTISRPIQPLDLIERREVLQSRVEEKVLPEGLKAGVTIKEVRFLEPDMPPEILIPRKRQQLAIQMIKTLEQEQKAQTQRIAKENAAATADQQSKLVEAQIAVETAKLYEKQQERKGAADQKYLEAVAIGQKKQALVLGEERVVQLKLAELLLTTLAEKPELVQLISKLVPDTVVFGGGDMNGPAAIIKSALGGGSKGATTPAVPSTQK